MYLQLISSTFFNIIELQVSKKYITDKKIIGRQMFFSAFTLYHVLFALNCLYGPSIYNVCIEAGGWGHKMAMFADFQYYL